jgi:hypothetical protein
MAREWTIFQNVRNVTYSDQPVGFDTLKSDKEYEMAFLKTRPGANDFVFKDAEGKTVHRIHRSGFVRHEPLPEAA